jgi:hypothetical protein
VSIKAEVRDKSAEQRCKETYLKRPQYVLPRRPEEQQQCRQYQREGDANPSSSNHVKHEATGQMEAKKHYAVRLIVSEAYRAEENTIDEQRQQRQMPVMRLKQDIETTDTRVLNEVPLISGKGCVAAHMQDQQAGDREDCRQSGDLHGTNC